MSLFLSSVPNFHMTMYRLLVLSYCIAHCLLWNTTRAMMASPRFFTEHQPDGSAVTLRLRGDEKSHWITDEQDFLVLQAHDGTYVYAIEDDVEDEHESSPKQNQRIQTHSKSIVVGNFNPVDLHKRVKAERVMDRNIRSSNNTKFSMLSARHHPQELNTNEFQGDCFKLFCGEIPEPRSSDLVGNNLHRTRYLRKQNPMIDRESSAQVSTAQFHRRQSSLPTTGTIKNLVILLQFKDHKEQRRKLPDFEDIKKLTDNLTDFYLKNSLGKLTIESNIIQKWYTTKHNESWYAEGKSGTTNLHEAMRETLDYLETTAIADLFDYDGNRDGYVDSVTFLHSGYGAEHGGLDCSGQDYRHRIWTHQWQLYGDNTGENIGPWASKISRYLHGETVKVWNYQMASALDGVCGNSIAPVGAVAHEFGHTMGLPDLSSGRGNGIGGFCLMADAWGFDETLEHPSQMSAWAKLKLGWLDAKKPSFGTNRIALAGDEPPETTIPQLYKIGDGDFNFPKDEYLLIEYRARRGLDAGLPGEGLLIYHIDESEGVPDNNNEGHPWQEDDWPRNGRHYKVALVQADRLFSLERGINNGEWKDFFSPGYVDALVPSNNIASPWEGPFPNTDSYQNGKVSQTGVKIYHISSAENSTMSFTFRGTHEGRLRGSSQDSTHVDPGIGRANQWKWKLGPSLDIGFARYPVELGEAIHYHDLP